MSSLSGLRRCLISALLTGLLAVPLLAQDFDIDESSLAEEGRLVLQTLKEELGVDLTGWFEFQLSEPYEIAAALTKELIPQYDKVLTEEVESKVLRGMQARSAAQQLSTVLLAKYATEDRVVMVSPDCFETLSDQLSEPDLLSREAFRAVLIHECAHALAHQRYGWPETLQQCGTADEIAAFNAVIEGHAQFVAQGICESRGWSAGFEVFTRCISKGIPQADTAVNQMSRVNATTTASAYSDGERFIRELFLQQGQAGIERAFRDPPRTPELIFHVDWYLDPESRPLLTHDLEAGITVFLAAFPEEDWIHTRATLTTAQLRASIDLLPSEDVDRIESTLRANRSGVARPRTAPQSKLLVVLLLEYSTEAEALFHVEAGRKLSLIKDEQMTTGLVRIVSASYESVEGHDWKGVVIIKELLSANQPSTVHSLIAHRGTLALELLIAGEATTIEELISTAERLFSAATKD